jgi:hypothetical protein
MQDKAEDRFRKIRGMEELLNVDASISTKLTNIYD